MRIGIDARELGGHPTGVGRYLAQLLRAWNLASSEDLHEFVLYAPAELASSVRERAGFPALRTMIVSAGHGSGTWWEQAHLASALRHDRPDVLLAPAYTAPLAGGVPVVLALHDVSFLAHPEWFPPLTRLRRRLITGLSARRARLVLTLTEFSRREILDRLGVPPAKVRVIPLAAGAPAGAAPVRRADLGEVRDVPTVLFVGSIFNRRHLPDLIRGFAMVSARHPGIRLEVVGDDRTFPPQDLAAIAAAAGVGDRVRIRSFVPDDVLAGLYASASAFAFLSDYEGFGLTPLEALAAGVPVVAGDTPVAREVLGNAALYVDTRDVAGIAARLEGVLFDAGVRSALAAASGAVIGRYSWERTGRETLAALVEAAHA